MAGHYWSFGRIATVLNVEVTKVYDDEPVLDTGACRPRPAPGDLLVAQSLDPFVRSRTRAGRTHVVSAAPDEPREGAGVGLGYALHVLRRRPAGLGAVQV
ncbi:hypothetical protein [Streptomyces sp. SAS_270]|uniref:hypothetical protein n=1 Tax=Streptomyces sp. SAS_270 TaxID=3412748 RepID=UPI00403C5C0F